MIDAAVEANARDFSPRGTTNTETTSLAILELSTPSAYHPYGPYSAYLPAFVAAIAALVLVEVFDMRRWSRRREKATENAVRFS